MTTNTHSSDQQVIAENELREQIVQARYSKYDKYEKLDPTEQEIIDRIMHVFAKAKQAWTVEARIDELRKLYPLLEQGYSGGAFVVRASKIDDRLAELKTPTAESEVEG